LFAGQLVNKAILKQLVKLKQNATHKNEDAFRVNV
jgi:hypothetical protein